MNSENPPSGPRQRAPTSSTSSHSAPLSTAATVDVVFEISKILDSGLDRRTVQILMALIDAGVHPTALVSQILKHALNALICRRAYKAWIILSSIAGIGRQRAQSPGCCAWFAKRPQRPTDAMTIRLALSRLPMWANHFRKDSAPGSMNEHLPYEPNQREATSWETKPQLHSERTCSCPRM